MQHREEHWRRFRLESNSRSHLHLLTALCAGADEASAPTQTLLNEGASVAVWFGFGGDYYGCGYAVAWLQLQQADALGIAA